LTTGSLNLICATFSRLGLFAAELLLWNPGREESRDAVILHIMKFCVQEPQHEARAFCGSCNYLHNKPRALRKCF
jgi:hypothetical protein